MKSYGATPSFPISLKVYSLDGSVIWVHYGQGLETGQVGQGKGLRDPEALRTGIFVKTTISSLALDWSLRQSWGLGANVSKVTYNLFRSGNRWDRIVLSFYALSMISHQPQWELLFSFYDLKENRLSKHTGFLSHSCPDLLPYWNSRIQYRKVDLLYPEIFGRELLANLLLEGWWTL